MLLEPYDFPSCAVPFRELFLLEPIKVRLGENTVGKRV